MSISVSIVEDDSEVRTSLARLINGSSGYRCVSQHGSGEDALQEIPAGDNSSQLHWEEKGRELSWHNQLYDVVKTVSRQGQQYMLCLADEKEEQLVRDMCRSSAQHRDRKSGNPLLLKVADDFTLHHYLIVVASCAIVPFTYSTYTAQLSQRPHDILAPPPRC